MSRLLIGVSGGIAAYKAIELARLASLRGHGVRVVMTAAAERFVGAASFEGIVGAPVLIDEFEPDPARGAYPGEPVPEHQPITHLAVAQRADAMIVAPASANTIAKLASGACDSMLTTSFVAATCPRLVAPAMNDRMWLDAATRDNVEVLRQRGVRVIEPGEGALASRGEAGTGRLAEPEAMLAELELAALGEARGPWRDLSVLVTAGGTREPIDSVRYIGNRSSGRMGVALAEAAARRGARVELVAANVSVPTTSGVLRTDVRTAAELAERTRQGFPGCDVLIMAAAVADFTPQAPLEGKLEREREERLSLELEPTEDVLASLATERRADQLLVGFAAEHGAGGIERARRKLEGKDVDAIVFNDVSRSEIGFDAELNEVTIVGRDGDHPIAIGAKEAVAESVLDRLDELRRASRGPSATGA